MIKGIGWKQYDPNITMLFDCILKKIHRQIETNIPLAVNVLSSHFL